MNSKVYSTASVGLDAELVEVECDAGTGMFHFIIVGLPDTAVQESRERVRSAIKNSGLEFPRGRVTVNLAPAHIRKEGAGYDLAITLSILRAGGHLQCSDDDFFEKSLFLGELSLDGTIRPVAGVLSSVMTAREKGMTAMFVPRLNAQEAALIEGVDIYPLSNLTDIVGHCTGQAPLTPFTRIEITVPISSCSDEEHAFAHIKGHDHAKRALEIAAAGAHNVLLIGPPGSGKTMLAKVFASLLPPLSTEEALEVTRIYSAAGFLINEGRLLQRRPFRNPHHTVSAVAMVGGGSIPRPGEITLSHRGVLFLDELPEFPRSCLEALRQPLEDGVITISRSAGSVEYPAKFILIAAQNPCPCGYYGSGQPCTCSASAVLHYSRKISGPLLDRIDLFIEVPGLEFDALTAAAQPSDVTESKDRIASARARQLERFVGTPRRTNAEMNSRQIEEYCPLNAAAEEILRKAYERLHLSARSFTRVLKVARTIADIDGSEGVEVHHIAESLQYRPKSVGVL